MKTEKQKRIGQYLIQRSLGSGTMGRVYKVLVPNLNKTAALKLFKPTKALIRYMGMDRLKKQFKHEASVIANIRHPNIASIWNLEETDGHLYYIMDYYCRNLGKLIGETYWADAGSRIIPVKQACGYLLQILQGLSRLHDAQIIHRDIKPFNIMISDLGIVKIVDFGLSKRRGEKQLLAHDKLTLGTPFYTAPEQRYSPETTDGRADLYSAGIILYRMITGRFPDPHPTALSNVQPGLDHPWDLFIQKALAPLPGERFQTAFEMAADLKGLMDQYDPSNECKDEKLWAESRPVNGPLRSTPERVLAKHAVKSFNLNKLHQPRAYIQNIYEENGDLVIDRATGLVWQRAGSKIPVQWHHAQDYIDGLCQTQFGGYTDWRLPTMNELLSLLRPPSWEGFCHEPVFSDIQKCLWSADTRSKKSAWAMDLEMGFIDSSEKEDIHFVKGVCSLKL